MDNDFDKFKGIFEGASFNNCRQNFIFGNKQVTVNDGRPTVTDSDGVKNALEELLAATVKDKNGKEVKLMTEQYQWYAVFRVLSELRNFPKQRSDFQTSMERMGMDKANPPCVYNNWRNKDTEVPKFSCSVTQWEQYRELSKIYAKMCDVADFLMKELG